MWLVLLICEEKEIRFNCMLRDFNPVISKYQNWNGLSWLHDAKKLILHVMKYVMHRGYVVK